MQPILPRLCRSGRSKYTKSSLFRWPMATGVYKEPMLLKAISIYMQTYGVNRIWGCGIVSTCGRSVSLAVVMSYTVRENMDIETTYQTACVPVKGQPCVFGHGFEWKVWWLWGDLVCWIMGFSYSKQEGDVSQLVMRQPCVLALSRKEISVLGWSVSSKACDWMLFCESCTVTLSSSPWPL